MINILKCFFVMLFIIIFINESYAQHHMSLEGYITDINTSQPIPGASVILDNESLWAVSDASGYYKIQNINISNLTIKVSSLGYQSQTITIKLQEKCNTYNIAMKESNLTLDEVVITAQKRTETQSSSYMVDRNTLDHEQVVNLNYITTLLPGGKTIGDQNLASGSNRISIHSGSAAELGNASFGTAIDIDGQRLENNAVFGETKGVDLRNIGSSNIESIEVVAGIPSVEYGDLSNGIVKINTRKGRTPYMIECLMEPKTKSVALSKGFKIGNKMSVLNVNAERTSSVTKLTSPFTAYERNNLNLTYSDTYYDKQGHPMQLSASIAGNIGGYDSKADPDEFKDTYTKVKDNMLRANIRYNWLLDKSWISNFSFQANFMYRDMTTEDYTNKSSASTQPYIHTTETGYYVAELYDDNPNANIILSPTGYWYVRSFNESKPLTYSFKAKSDWMKRWGNNHNTLMYGIEFNGSGNVGKGLYYEDMRVAPTWREYRYDEVPFMNNIALFLEEKYSVKIRKYSSFHITAGLRSDITHIKNSDYGIVANLSPRLNAKYVLWDNTDAFVSSMSIYGGWGKSVKQPSFTVLYPAPTYRDNLSFAPGTTSDGTTFYAYYTQPTTPKYNPDLKWQYVIQNEVGLETTIGVAKISVSAYNNKTNNPYMSRYIYTPYSYKITTQSDIEADCNIPTENRLYTIDPITGIVTVKDRTGAMDDQILGYRERNTFVSQIEYTNGTPIYRRGIDWIVDFEQISILRTSFRLDGNYYYYKGLNETMVASTGWASASMDGTPYKYIGYYSGSSSVSNGSLSHQINTNFTIITHIPQIRMIFSIRIESSLLDYSQTLSEYYDGSPRGFVLENADDFHGTNDNGIYNQDSYVAVYPEYYTSWQSPDEKIPFLEKFLWAKENDPELYQDLSKLVVKSNTTYRFNEDRITAYFAANFNLTKEIGDNMSLTFYARNFFYQMGKVYSSQTDLETSLFDSTYIPQFYYGLSARFKL